MNEAPVCDLVLLSWNHLEETRTCLDSLFRTTQVPCRLFIVDNGSEPPVRAFLAGVRPQGAAQEVTVLQNETNEGFPRGMNRGIRASTAPFVCLLNNDLEFTSGWLEEMLKVARAQPAIGVLNPVSSTYGKRPPRGVSLEAYAEGLRARSGDYTEVGTCIGFCFLVKREVLNRVGLLNEDVERIFFEDEDYCMRVQQAGYRCVVAEAAYVYHAEHSSVRRVPEREALFARNRVWCEARWGRRLRVAWVRAKPIVSGSPELRVFLERLVAWARRRTYVYVYSPMPSGQTKETLFKSVALVPHSDVVWRRVPSSWSRWASVGLILKRRKKPFDLIVGPDAGWRRWMARLRWLHRAEVVPESDEDELRRQWERRSRPAARPGEA